MTDASMPTIRRVSKRGDPGMANKMVWVFPQVYRRTVTMDGEAVYMVDTMLRDLKVPARADATVYTDTQEVEKPPESKTPRASTPTRKRRRDDDDYIADRGGDDGRKMEPMAKQQPEESEEDDD